MQGGVPTVQFSHECRDIAKCSTEWIISHRDEGPFSVKFVANCEAPLQMTSDLDTIVTICLMDEGFWNVRRGDRMQKIEDFLRYTVPSKQCDNCSQNQGTCKSQYCTKGCPHLELYFEGGRKSGVMIREVPIQGGNRTLDDLFVTKIGVSDPKKQKPGKKLMRLVALVNVDVNTNNNNIINNNNISPQKYLIVVGQTDTFKVMSNRWVRQLRANEAQQFANERKQISQNTIQNQYPNQGVQHFDSHNWLQRQYNISSSSQQQQYQQQQQQYSQQQQQQQQYLLNQGVDNNTIFGIRQNLVLLQQQVEQVLLQIQQLNQRQQQSEQILLQIQLLNQRQQQSEQILLQIQQQIQRLQQDEQNNNNNNWDINLSHAEFDQNLNEQDSISDMPLML